MQRCYAGHLSICSQIYFLPVLLSLGSRSYRFPCKLLLSHTRRYWKSQRWKDGRSLYLISSPGRSQGSPQSSHNLLWIVVYAQSCLTVYELVDYSPSGSSAHRIFLQEYWSGLSCPPPWDLPNLGIVLCLQCLLHWQADSLPLSHL